MFTIVLFTFQNKFNMDSINYYSLFYWLSVADNAKDFFVTMIWIFTAVCLVSTICYFANGDSGDEKNQKMSRKWMWWGYPFATFFWALFIFTPSKRDALLIVAGGGTMEFLTTDTSAKKIPHELSNFVVSELKSMAMDAKVNFLTETKKEEILTKAKDMSATELMETMKTDTNFAKIILDK